VRQQQYRTWRCHPQKARSHRHGRAIRHIPPQDAGATPQGSRIQMKFSQEVQELIKDRSQGKCEMCGSKVLQYQIHHRRPRGMGGSKVSVVGSAANGVLLHPKCHTHIELNRNEARDNGWLVQQSFDPTVVPFKRFNGWVTFSEDGTYMLVKPSVVMGGK